MITFCKIEIIEGSRCLTFNIKADEYRIRVFIRTPSLVTGSGLWIGQCLSGLTAHFSFLLPKIVNFRPCRPSHPHPAPDRSELANIYPEFKAHLANSDSRPSSRKRLEWTTGQQKRPEFGGNIGTVNWVEKTHTWVYTGGNLPDCTVASC